VYAFLFFAFYILYDKFEDKLIRNELFGAKARPYVKVRHINNEEFDEFTLTLCEIK
jgi:hypothetical protein